MSRPVATTKALTGQRNPKFVTPSEEASTIKRCSPPDFPTAYCLLPTAYCFSSRHARPGWALSTLDEALGAHRLFLVGSDSRDVPLLQFAQLCIVILRVGLVPGETLKVSLKPRHFSKDLTTSRIDFLAHLHGVLDK